ncbi:MAG: hypothetical protein BroJett040_24270 [Oligoflexia bacterium]|nr:MAG: hypothetical protein BroJett040_24270 [Oligoflexia bacterium]
MNDEAINLSKISYTIIPGKNCPSEHSQLYDAAYNFWFHFWSQVYLENGATAKPNPDDFFRQDFIPIIHSDNTIIAMHLYSLFELNCSSIFHQSYLEHNFSAEYFKIINDNNITSVMTMESLSVNLIFRKSHLGLSLGKVIGILGQKLFLTETTCDSIICPARKDVKVSDMAQEAGFRVIVPNQYLHNTPVDLLMCKRSDIIEPKDFEVRRLVDILWKKRTLIKGRNLKIANAAA